MASIPIIDVCPLFSANITSTSAKPTIDLIHEAFKTWGFFVLTGAASPAPSTTNSLAIALSKFFALSSSEKRALDLRNNGWRWRGYMPFGGEGTKRNVDQKEGFYGGGEHSPNHPHFSLPTHGANVFPSESQVPGMKDTTLKYIDDVTELGKTLCDAISVALGLPASYFRENLLCDEGPVQLFRAFHYIGKEEQIRTIHSNKLFGIGEHTDFGLLTILHTQGTGLQVLAPNSTNQWVDVPVIPDSFVVNVGDILDRLSSGIYRSRPHRVVLPPPGSDRLSIPFFFDPAWTAKITALPISEEKQNVMGMGPKEKMEAAKRWENTTFTKLDGIWAQYLAEKVKKVFPEIETLGLPEFPAVSRESTRHLLEVSKVGQKI
jgi:isopenicillin N synthase-like dioxygenase